jgi:hypothetical protein
MLGRWVWGYRSWGHSKESRRNGTTVPAFLQNEAEDIASKEKADKMKNTYESRSG